MIEILATPLFLFGFLPIALFLARGAAGVFLAPVIAAVVAIYSAILHVLLDLPIIWFWSATLLLSAILVLVIPASRLKLLESVAALKSPSEHWLVAVGGLAGVVSLATTPPPLGWDARSMWFAIPSWLNGPSEQYLTAQLGGAQTGWPEYPFFGPASFATLWQLMGVNEDLWAASRLSGVLAICLGAVAIAMFISRFASDSQLWIKLSVMAGYLFSLFFVADGYINNGYQDVMQGAAIALVLVTVITYNPQHRLVSFSLVAVASLAALNIKQEGFWFTVAVILLGAIYWAFKRELWFGLGLLPAIAGKLVWDGFGAAVQMPASGSTDGMFSRLPELLSGSSVAGEVLGKIFGSWFPQLHLGTMVVLVAVSVLLVMQKKLLEAALLGLSGLALYAIPVITYALGNSRDSIDWWLGTSYTRITASFTIVVFLSIAALVLWNAPSAKRAVANVARVRQPKSKKRR